MIEFLDDEGMARELLTPNRKERTAHWTHCACSAARLLFLFSHGVLVLSVSTLLNRLTEATWWVLFLPVWLGDALCVVLIIGAWFASCPYIKFCVGERQQRHGPNNPSILTEILPEILMAVLGFFFLIVSFCGEYALCSYLDSVQRGQPHTLAAVIILLGLSGAMSLCHGVCIVSNCAVFATVGVAVLATLVIFAATREGEAAAQALCLMPAVIAVAVLIIALVWRFSRTSYVLNREERFLRLGEMALLIVLFSATLSAAHSVSISLLSDASVRGCVAGASMCLVAALRGRMCCLELWQPVSERMLSHARTASRSATVQISLPPLSMIT